MECKVYKATLQVTIFEMCYKPWVFLLQVFHGRAALPQGQVRDGSLRLLRVPPEKDPGEDRGIQKEPGPGQ